MHGSFDCRFNKLIWVCVKGGIIDGHFHIDFNLFISFLLLSKEKMFLFTKMQSVCPCDLFVVFSKQTQSLS